MCLNVSKKHIYKYQGLYIIIHLARENTRDDFRRMYSKNTIW